MYPKKKLFQIAGVDNPPEEYKISEGLIPHFKNLILSMYKDFPQGYYHNYIETIIQDEEIKNYLIKEKIFVKRKQGYSLGINGVLLANNYGIENLAKETKKLTKSMNKLTCWIMGLTATMTLITISSFIFQIFLR